MSQFIALSSDDQSILPPSTIQSNKTEPRLSYSIDDVAASSAIEPTPKPQNIHNSSNTSIHSSRNLDERLLVQAQQGFEQVGKGPLREWQSLPNLSAMIPPASLLITTPFEQIGYSSLMQQIIPQPIVSRAFETLSKNMYSQLQFPRSPMIDNFGAYTKGLSSTAALALGEITRSSLIIGMEDAQQRWKNMFPKWDALLLPELSFSELHITNSFHSMLSFTLDMNWLTNLTAQMNSLLLSLPPRLSFDLRGFKESIKQRLIAVFKAIEFCFAPSMSEELMYQIADTYERNGKRSSITLLIWNYYARPNHIRLQRMVEGWQDNPEYARRWQDILRPALDAHRRGEYGLSISALTPLVEGVSSHVVKKNTLLPAQKPRRGQLGLGSTESVILRTIRTAGDEANLESYTTDVAHWLRVTSTIGFVEDVFCEPLEFEKNYDHIHLRDHRPHRHGLLHGYQTKAMTALNSLRLFLLLDGMHGLLQNYIARGGII